jgi:hypothetical protein
VSARKHQDDVRILQRFWTAELRDRKLTTRAIHSLSVGGGTTSKTYRTRAAAERAAEIELAKMIRLGYQSIPCKELAPLQRFAAKASRARFYPPEKAAPPDKVYAAHLQKFWRAKRDLEVVVTTSGDIAGKTQSKTKRYRDIGLARWSVAEDAPLHEGYYTGSVRELTALQRYLKALNARLAKA